MTTVVIIPGSFAKPNLYVSLTKSLARHDIQCEVVDLPSVGRREGKPPGTMADDVNEIVATTTKLLDQDKDVVFLTHSYGGVPGTQSLERLSRKARQAEGKKGGVGKIIYMAAVALPVGGSVLGLLTAPDFLKIDDDYMTLEPEGSAPFTFSDFPPEEALKLAKALPEQATASYRDELTYPGYEDAEVHYIVCEKDKLVLTEYQYGMVEFLRGVTKGEVGLHKLNSGHSPYLTQPDNVTKIVKEIIEKKQF
ncbi:hypothetical protein FSARC_13454 [Fusarium sarcochroum]|uniref:AB hydrolase-1 domain-containing protein n=1 Tax=Fusarium sarcochroum TaxID=1208366 RepID=A0A8H4T195_9HYPO|nr:hypothetical protein FSARC_13454 [Fusarium sarcochroum]